MFLTTVNCVSDYVAHGFPQNIFFGHTMNLLIHRKRADHLHHVMIEK